MDRGEGEGGGQGGGGVRRGERGGGGTGEGGGGEEEEWEWEGSEGTEGESLRKHAKKKHALYAQVQGKQRKQAATLMWKHCNQNNHTHLMPEKECDNKQQKSKQEQQCDCSEIYK